MGVFEGCGDLSPHYTFGGLNHDQGQNILILLLFHGFESQIIFIIYLWHLYCLI